ncbi:MAG: TetR/AcrR family transcriptional regulator [Deltaproteobacteria bacterium]|nr:TetR/AcrR family transcriptional regulator [Deltaproteobacteria bacterium]
MSRSSTPRTRARRPARPGGERAPTGKRGRPKGGNGAQTRDQILDAAERLYAEKGFAGTAIRDIARVVGLNPASLYAHFPGKDSIYAAVLTRGLKPFVDINHLMLGTTWTEVTMARGMDALMDHLAQRPRALRLVLHEALTGGAHLPTLVREWLEPGYSLAVTAFRSGGQPLLRPEWDDDDLPDLVASVFFLMLGHVVIAPLLADVFGGHAAAAQSVPRRVEFLRKAVRVLLFETKPVARKPARTRSRGSKEKKR